MRWSWRPRIGPNRLLNSLLLLARTQARGVSVLQEVDLADLVAPALLAVDAERAERDLTVSIDGRPAPVRGDPALLERLVGNLVENAVRHNLPAGWIGIAPDQSPVTAFSRWHRPARWSIEQAVAELFEPFRQGQRARTGHRGTGLGLSIVRAVVAAHGGTVGAVPESGGGLRVLVELPGEPG